MRKISMRIDQPLLMQLDQATTEAELKRSELIRRACRQYLGPGQGHAEALAAEKMFEDEYQFRQDMIRVGSNLNQVAHHLNAGGSIEDDAFLALHNELRTAFAVLSKRQRKMEEALAKIVTG